MALALLLLLTFSIVGAALWIAGSHENRTDLRVERRIVVAQRDELLADLSRVSIDYSWWDEAFERVKARDVDWLDRNYGEFLYKVHGLDMAVIRSPSGDLVYASLEGRARQGGSEPALRCRPGPAAGELAGQQPDRANAGCSGDPGRWWRLRRGGERHSARAGHARPRHRRGGRQAHLRAADRRAASRAIGARLWDRRRCARGPSASGQGERRAGRPGRCAGRLHRLAG